MFCNPGVPDHNFRILSNSAATLTVDDRQIFPEAEVKHLRVVRKKTSSSLREISWTWVLITTTVMLLLSALYCLSCNPEGALGGRPFRGYVLGITNAVMVTFLTLYSARKRIGAFSYGRLETWLNIHIRIGLISMLLTLMHTGFQVRGAFSLALFPSFVLTIVSGIFGSFCYILIPRAIATKARNAFGKEEITLRQMMLLKEANDLTAGISNTLSNIYSNSIKPLIYNKRSGFRLFCLSFRKNRPPLATMERIRKGSLSMLEEEERQALENLFSKVREKFELEEKLFSMNVIDRWRDVHIVLTAIMLSLLGIHIVSVCYF